MRSIPFCVTTESGKISIGSPDKDEEISPALKGAPLKLSLGGDSIRERQRNRARLPDAGISQKMSREAGAFISPARKRWETGMKRASPGGATQREAGVSPQAARCVHTLYA